MVSKSKEINIVSKYQKQNIKDRNITLNDSLHTRHNNNNTGKMSNFKEG